LTVAVTTKVAVLPARSRAVQVTGDEPTGNLDPLGGSHSGVTGPSRLSVALGVS
jgi:hypothetical protein